MSYEPRIVTQQIETLSGVNDIQQAGRKDDGEKPMMALIPPHALEAEAAVWTFGSKKYDAFNWAKGIKYNRILSALMRHTNAIVKGEDLDPESGLPHAAHIRCCAAMLIEFANAGRTDLDDRYKGGKT